MNATAASSSAAQASVSASLPTRCLASARRSATIPSLPAASRNHNNANILTMGQRVIGEGLALDIVDVWLESEFDGGRHERRVNEISDIEKKVGE